MKYLNRVVDDEIKEKLQNLINQQKEVKQEA